MRHGTRQLYLDGHNIVLDCEKGRISLPYNIHRWNLVYIELNNPPEGEMDSIFRVNEKSPFYWFIEGFLWFLC